MTVLGQAFSRTRPGAGDFFSRIPRRPEQAQFQQLRHGLLLPKLLGLKQVVAHSCIGRWVVSLPAGDGVEARPGPSRSGVISTMPFVAADSSPSTATSGRTPAWAQQSGAGHE